MTTFSNICRYGACALFIFGAILAYSFVMDCEPMAPDKAYSLDRDAFNRNNDNWSREFPSFAEWYADRDASTSRFNEWLNNIAEEAGYEYAACFDPTLDCSASAPDNWNNGRE